MKVVLLNDTDGRENIGCRLTSSTLKKNLSQGFGLQNSGVEIEPFHWRFGKGRDTGQVWMSGLFWVKSDPNAVKITKFVDWLTKLSKRQYGEKAVNATLEADLVVFHPEGSISSYHDSVRIMNLLCLPLLACIKGVCVSTINGTFPLYSLDDRRFRLIYAFLHACHYSLLRDRLSATHYGVRFMPDSAIMHEITESAYEKDVRPYVLITTGANFSKRMNLAIGREAIRFCDDYNLKPLILTKKHKDLRPLKGEIDKRGGLFLENTTLEESEKWLSQCSVHIGGRYHMALFGLLLGVPSVLILTNTHKNRWLANDFSGVMLGSDPKDMYKKATYLYGRRLEILSMMSESIFQAKKYFIGELEMMVNAVQKNYLKQNTADLIDECLCLETLSELKFSDFISFWPLGVRLKFASRN